MSAIRHITEPTTPAPVPQTIEVIFTEQDRQSADHFQDGCMCILATALNRTGYSGISERVTHTMIEINGQQVRYNHQLFMSHHAQYLGGRNRPLYGPHIVDRRLLLTRD